MKINWKVLIALVLVVAVIYWAVDLVRPHSYSGTNLNFGVGSGTVTVTNPSNTPVSAQLVGAGTSSFRVSSTNEGISGASTKQRNGTTSTHVFEFELPPGVSEFTIARGADVSFVADTVTGLQATVNSVSDDTLRITIIVAAVVVVGMLFYISRTTGHRWINILRRQKTSVPVLKPVAEGPAGGQGHAIRSYGDNRANIGD